MERVLTQEERIKRAEEIYLRRRAKNEYKPEYKTTNLRSKENNISKNKIIKRVVLQIIICLLLYCIFYLIYDTNFSFSEVTINKIESILNYDINFEFIYKNINNFIMSILPKDEVKENTEENINNEEINKETEESIEIETNEEINTINEEIIEKFEQGTNEEILVSKKQIADSEQEDIKDKYKLIVPLKGGYVSSKFGIRVPTSSIVSTNHKGIDIAASIRN